MKWHETYDNVTALGRWLLEQDAGWTAAQLQSYYERPDRWSSEWLAYQHRDDPVTILVEQTADGWTAGAALVSGGTSHYVYSGDEYPCRMDAVEDVWGWCRAHGRKVRVIQDLEPAAC